MKKRLSLALILLGTILVGRAILSSLGSQSQENPHTPSPTPPAAEPSISNFPEGLPENFPIYKDSEFISMTVSENGQGRSFIWHTTERPNLVYEYFKSDIKIKGWSVTDTSEIGSSFALSFEKEDTKGFFAAFRDGSDKTIISVTIGSRKP